MRPEFIFHTEGFTAAAELTTLASRQADGLLRRAPGLRRIRLMVIFEKMPNGAGIYAAHGHVDGPAGPTTGIEVASEPAAAIRRTFARLARLLASVRPLAP